MKKPDNTPRSTPLKKQTVRITLQDRPRDFSLAPPPRTIPSAPPPTPAEFGKRRKMDQILICAVHTGPSRDQINRASNQFLRLLGILVLCTVWASYIAQMILKTTATSQLVINGFTVVAFAPAAATIALIICTIWSTRAPRHAIQEIYAARRP